MDTAVLVGGRRGINRPPALKKLPEIFVENEENIRYRKERSPTNKTPDLKSRVEGRLDSGFGGGWNGTMSSTSSSSNSKLEEPSFKDHSYSDSSNLWDSFTSPVLNIKKKLSGRSSFIDEPIQFQVEPQNVVTGILVMVVLSSVCFSLFIGVNINNVNGNGKLSSVKFGAERRILNLKINNQIIDYDIKDESGNILGGKRAAIQFAYDKKADALDTKTKSTLSTKNQGKRAASDNSAEAPKIKKVETIVSDPVPAADAQNMNTLSIAELSKKIEELNFLIKGGAAGPEQELNSVEVEMDRLMQRKKDLVKKLQKSGKAKPQDLKAGKAERSAAVKSTAASKEKVKEYKPAVKPPKTEAKNPLTGSKTQVTPAAKGKSMSNKEGGADDGEADVEDVEADSDTDTGDEDYPDDPNFR